MRLAAALAAICLEASCPLAERPRIERERFARQATVELTGVTMDRREKWTRPAPPPVCEIGARRFCGGAPVFFPGATEPLYERCMRAGNGVAYWNDVDCSTPLVVVFDDAPVEFTQPPAVFRVGVHERTEWVSARTPWVALDRDGSGCIESARELFAGFGALAELDTNGDGRIDARDPAFADIVLWSDADQDKRCTPDELVPLSDRFTALPLAYLRHEPFEATSYEGETASLPNGARLVDVHLAGLP